MPACVVKSCKSHSGFHKKCQGITFHRFPTKNEVWRKDWIDIIRESRCEKDWVPSKTSVVCSNHFDPNDFYTTKGGRLLAVTFAVPKMYLSMPPNTREQITAEPAKTSRTPCEPDISSFLQGSPPFTEKVTSCLEQPLKSERSCSPSTSLFIPIRSSVSQEVTSYLVQPLKSEQSDSPSTSLLLPQCSAVTGAVTSSFEQSSMSEQSSSPTASFILPPNLTSVEASTAADFDLEDPLSVEYTPGEKQLKYKLMKRDLLIKNQRSKIKMLNQKVRRLEERNKSLRDILKTLKPRKT